MSIENIHHAEHMAQSERLADLNNPAIELIARILERGRAEGVFRRDVDPIDVHMMISAFCVFRVANRHTFGAIFGRDLTRPARGATTTARCSATWSSTTSAARPPDRPHRGQWVGTRRTDVISSSRTSTR